MPIVEKGAIRCHKNLNKPCLMERCSMWDQDPDEEGYCLEVEVKKAELEIQAHRISAIEEFVPILKKKLEKQYEDLCSRGKLIGTVPVIPFDPEDLKDLKPVEDQETEEGEPRD